MNLVLQPQTTLATNRAGQVVYSGAWAEALSVLPLFKVAQTTASAADPDTGAAAQTYGYSFVSWKPPAAITAAPQITARSIEAGADADGWKTLEDAIAAAGEVVSLGASLRAREGGRAELTAEITAPDGLRAKVINAFTAQGGLIEGEIVEERYDSRTDTREISSLARFSDVWIYANYWTNTPPSVRARGWIWIPPPDEDPPPPGASGPWNVFGGGGHWEAVGEQEPEVQAVLRALTLGETSYVMTFGTYSRDTAGTLAPPADIGANLNKLGARGLKTQDNMTVNANGWRRTETWEEGDWDPDLYSPETT